jgi:hypothetical protein
MGVWIERTAKKSVKMVGRLTGTGFKGLRKDGDRNKIPRTIAGEGFVPIRECGYSIVRGISLLVPLSNTQGVGSYPLV